MEEAPDLQAMPDAHHKKSGGILGWFVPKLKQYLIYESLIIFPVLYV
jgi:hypothetical protein